MLKTPTRDAAAVNRADGAKCRHNHDLTTMLCLALFDPVTADVVGQSHVGNLIVDRNT